LAFSSFGIRKDWTFEGEQSKSARADHGYSRSEVTRAWIPWVILSVAVFAWGTQSGKKLMNTPEKVFPSLATWHTLPSAITNPTFPVTGLHNLVQRVPAGGCKADEGARCVCSELAERDRIRNPAGGHPFRFGDGHQHSHIFKIYGRTIVKVRFSLLTIAAMLGIGILTRYSGVDATMG